MEPEIVNEKQKLISEMLEMQRQFMKYEHEHGVTAEEYWAGEEGHQLANYRDRFMEKARKVVELAHEEKQSKP